MSKKTGKEVNINIDDVLVNSVRSGDIRYKIPGQSVICHRISRQLVENWKKNKIDVGELASGKSVYILESVDDYGNIQGLYAGKTDIRKDGPIGRMCEHLTDDTSDLNGNKNMYWTTAYIFLVREDGQCVFERDNKSVDSLENALRNYLPKELCRTYRSSDEALGSFNTRVFNSIKAYIYKLIPDLFDEKDSKLESEVSNVKIDSKINTVNLYKAGDRIDNIVTPKKMVDEMLDEIEKPIPGIFKHDVVFIDLACKGGEFIEAIYNRLFNSTDLKQIDSEIKRANYILKYQLYGVALNEYSYNETVNKLEDLGSTLNIRQVRDVEFLNLLDKRDYSTPINIVTSGDNDITYRNYLDYILQSLFKKDIRNIKWKGKEERMRMAVMVGNPPYQKNIPDESNGFTMQAIYDRFMKLGVQCCDITSLIVPAKWTGDGKGYINELRDKVLHTGHLRHIKIINDSTPVFGDGVSTGKLTHFVYDNSYDGLTTVEFQDKNGDIDTKLRDLKLETGALVDNRAIYITGLKMKRAC